MKRPARDLGIVVSYISGYAPKNVRSTREIEMNLRVGSISLSLLLCGVSASQTAQSPMAPPPAPPAHFFVKDMTVYVSDFELDAQNVQVDQGSAVGQRRPGILERPEKKEQKDPQAQARKLVETLSTSIVADLQKAGYKAQRLGATDPKPTAGAWVHGVFTQADEGNRMQRAVIGFGSGEATMQLYATITNLAAPAQPFYTTAADSSSGGKPGAVITMNPYVAAAKFVMEKNAPEKTVKKTASEISKQIVQQLQLHATLSS